jgi:hypothetical protein
MASYFSIFFFGSPIFFLKQTIDNPGFAPI